MTITENGTHAEMHVKDIKAGEINQMLEDMTTDEVLRLADHADRIMKQREPLNLFTCQIVTETEMVNISSRLESMFTVISEAAELISNYYDTKPGTSGRHVLNVIDAAYFMCHDLIRCVETIQSGANAEDALEDLEARAGSTGADAN